VNVNFAKFGGSNFLKRMEYLKEKKEKKLEETRNQKKEDVDEAELTFHPELSSKSKGLKRDINDLFVNFSYFIFNRTGKLKRKITLEKSKKMLRKKKRS
jgi:hypothetical protein